MEDRRIYLHAHVIEVGLDGTHKILHDNHAVAGSQVDAQSVRGAPALHPLASSSAEVGASGKVAAAAWRHSHSAAARASLEALSLPSTASAVGPTQKRSRFATYSSSTTAPAAAATAADASNEPRVASAVFILSAAAKATAARQQRDEDTRHWMVHVAAPVTEQANNDVRAHIRAVGLDLGMYLPHNTFLVTLPTPAAAAGGAADATPRSSGSSVHDYLSLLRSAPGVLAVLPFEPKYKVDPSLWAAALSSAPAPAAPAADVLVHLLDSVVASREQAEALARAWSASAASSSSAAAPQLRVRAQAVGTRLLRVSALVESASAAAPEDSFALAEAIAWLVHQPEVR